MASKVGAKEPSPGRKKAQEHGITGGIVLRNKKSFPKKK